MQSGEQPPLEVSIKQHVDGSPMEITAALRQPRIVLAAGLVRSVLDFVEPVGPAFAAAAGGSNSDNATAESTSTPAVVAVTESTAPAAAAAPAKKDGGMLVSATLESALVVLPGDPTNEDAGAFVLGFGTTAQVLMSENRLGISMFCYLLCFTLCAAFKANLRCLHV